MGKSAEQTLDELCGSTSSRGWFDRLTDHQKEVMEAARERDKTDNDFRPWYFAGQVLDQWGLEGKVSKDTIVRWVKKKVAE